MTGGHMLMIRGVLVTLRFVTNTVVAIAIVACYRDPVNVRRLAAIDMHGAQGTRRRRRIITIEFVAGVLAMVSVGTWILAQASEQGGRALGLWFIGAGLNYVTLATYALLLSRPGALEAELTGVDAARELRRYGLLQLWILVPFSLVVVSARDVLGALARR